MPIDISHLRPSEEGGNIELVHQWQIIRNKINGNMIPEKDLYFMSTSCLDFYHFFMKAENEKREIKKQLNSCRRDLKSFQRQLRPTKETKKKNDSGESSYSPNDTVDTRCTIINIQEEIKKYKCEIIPQLEKDLHNITTNIDFYLLPMIHNQIDEVSFQPINRLIQQDNQMDNKFDEESNLKQPKESSKSITKKNSKDKNEIEIIDPLYAIGGYEKIKSMAFSQTCSNINNHDITMLTGVGSILEKVLTSHLLSLLNNSEAIRSKDTTNDDYSHDSDTGDNERNQSFQLINIPDGIQTELNLAHSIMGCVSSVNVCFEENSQYSAEEQKISSSLLSKSILSNNSSLCHICNLKKSMNKSDKKDKAHDKVCDLNLSMPKIPLPSYVTFSMFHQDQNYSENILPLKYISIIPDKSTYNIISPISSNTANTIHITTKGTKITTSQNNPLVASKKESNSKNKTKTKQSTLPTFSHPVNQLHLFALCTCDLYSSRQIQHQFVNHILDFHESLIVGNYEITSNKNTLQHRSNTKDVLWEHYKPSINKQSIINAPPLLRAYSLSSLHYEKNKTKYYNSSHTQLQPNEASRIIVEGYLPSINEYIELGHVSNFTDYISRSLNTKFGGGSNLKGIHGTIRNVEYVHSIYGTFAPLSTSIVWMLENNMVCATKDKRDNISSFKSKTNGVNKIKTTKDCNVKEMNVADGIVLPSYLVLPYCHLWGEKYVCQWEKHPKIFLNPSNKVEKHTKEFGFVIPFIRRNFLTKHGKPITRLINKSSLLYDHYIFGIKECEDFDMLEQKQSMNETENLLSSASGVINMTSAKVLLKHPNEILTSKDISHEALSNPYDFLPFYK